MAISKNLRHLVTAGVVTCLFTPIARAEQVGHTPTEIEALRQQLESVVQQNQHMAKELHSLRDEVESARDEAAAAHARTRDLPPVENPLGQALYSSGTGPLGTRLKLFDMSLDVLTGVGGSTANDGEIFKLQQGDHDPRRRGFNLQAAELAIGGAVDPYFDGQVNLTYFIDTHGESQFEVEEAYATSRMLPFSLERYGLQLKAGQFFTDFGRANHRHAHQWSWQDQPVILSRFFGTDGMRGSGAELSWLTPLPGASELILGIQNAQGDTMTSFNSSKAGFQDRAIGGRPFNSNGTHGLGDFVYLARLKDGFDISDTWSGEVGASALYGPNATGKNGNTQIFGGDFVFKWQPLSQEQGYPYVTLQGEALYRRYHADAFTGCVQQNALGVVPTCSPANMVNAASGNLYDWGGYAQALWGFKRNWSAGLRAEYGTGNNGNAALLARNSDAFRDTRWRLSPLLIWQATHFARVRIQYNWDHAQFTQQSSNHTLWMGLEFLLGSHPAHNY